MKKLFSASIMALSFIAFSNASNALTSLSFKDLMSDFKERVSNFVHRHHKAAPKFIISEDTVPAVTYPRQSINLSSYNPIGTISVGLTMLEQMGQSVDEKSTILPASLPLFMGIRTSVIEDDIENSAEMKKHSISPASTQSGSSIFRDYENKKHDVSLVGSQGSFSTSTEDAEWEPLPNDDAYNGPCNYSRDTVFLQSPIDDGVKQKIWFQKLIQRGKDYDKAKYPYRGFINVKDTHGKSAGRLTLGLKALFNIKEE